MRFDTFIMRQPSISVLFFCFYGIRNSISTHQNDVKACYRNDNCDPREWCAKHSRGFKFCKPYADFGESCNVFGSPEDHKLCNPDVHYCNEPMRCIIPDIGGVCVEKSHLLKVGDCCGTNIQCESGVCEAKERFQRTCQVGVTI